MFEFIRAPRTHGQPPTEEACFFPVLGLNNFQCYKCGKSYKRNGTYLDKHIKICEGAETKRIARTEPQRRAIAQRQDWKCANPHGKCTLSHLSLDGFNYELDHKTALCDGGTDDDTNLQALCSNCHSWKTQLERCIHKKS